MAGDTVMIIVDWPGMWPGGGRTTTKTMTSRATVLR